MRDARGGPTELNRGTALTSRKEAKLQIFYFFFFRERERERDLNVTQFAKLNNFDWRGIQILFFFFFFFREISVLRDTRNLTISIGARVKQF